MTAQDVIKSFFYQLSNHGYASSSSVGVNMLDSAVRASSRYSSIQDVIDAMKADQESAEKEAVEKVLGESKLIADVDSDILSAKAVEYQDVYKKSNLYIGDNVNYSSYSLTVKDVINERKATIFLEKYCGIILEKNYWYSSGWTSWGTDNGLTGNTDTGAITGLDAGGSSVAKTASSVVPEIFINTYTASTSTAQNIITNDRNWVIQATDADDTITANGADSINAGAGDDEIIVNASGATVTSGDGNDFITVSSAVDDITLSDLNQYDTLTISGEFEIASAQIEDSLLVVTDKTGTRKIRFGDFDTAKNAKINSTTIGEWLKDAGINLNNLNTVNYSEGKVLSSSNVVEFSNAATAAVTIDLDTVDTSDEGDVTIDGEVVGSLSSTFPNASTFTRNGLTLHLLGVTTSSSGSTSKITEKTLDELTDDQRTIVAGLFKWWISESLKLNEESFGLSFNSSTAAVKDMGLFFYNSSSSNILAAAPFWKRDEDGSTIQLMLKINMRYYTDISSDNVDGKSSSTTGYLDRTLAHELTHSVMETNINYFNTLPQFIVEGSAELVHGIDDERGARIFGIAADASRLNTVLNVNNTSTGQPDYYAGGYMFFRYFAKQAAAQTESLPAYGEITATVNLNSDGDYYISGNSTSENASDSGNIKLGTVSDGVYTVENSGVHQVITNTNNLKIVGLTVNDTLIGSRAADIIETAEGTFINAGGGSDSIKISGQFATIYAGDDNDTVTAEDGSHHFMDLGDGDNIVTFKKTRSYNSTVTSGAGDDTIVFDWLEDSSITAGEGADTIYFGGSNNTLGLGGGNDTVYFKYSNMEENFIELGAGDDRAIIFGENNTIIGGAGNDSFYSNSSIGNYFVFDSDFGTDTISGYETIDSILIPDTFTYNQNNSVLTIIDKSTGETKGTVILKDFTDTANVVFETGNEEPTDGADSISNTISGISINALGGDDTIDNSGANVSINGGAGNDSIINSGSEVLINGDDDDDTIGNDSYGVNSTLNGGAGDDSIWNNAAALVDGGEGADSIENRSGAANATISGGAGNDSILNSSAAQIYGDDGADTIGNDSYGVNATLNGGVGNDYIWNNAAALVDGGEGADSIENRSGAANATINGGAGNDSILNSSAAQIYGDDGADTISNTNLGSKATLSGGDGNDLIYTYNAASVSIDGGADNDNIWLFNSSNKLTVKGGTGNDTIHGVSLEGDVLYQYAAGDGNDLIDCFNSTSSLSISGDEYSSTTSGDDIIISVGDGSITLNGAASLSTVNIIGTEKIVISTVPTEGADSISNTISGATINALGGDDTINNSGENVLIPYNTGDGNDSIIGFNATSTLSLSSDEYSSVTSGNDIIIGVGDGAITLNGAASLETVNIVTFINNINNENANSLISGTDNADSITNSAQNVTINGNGGKDTVSNSGNNVTINGGAGNDSLHSERASNVLINGDDGDDTLGTYYTSSTNITLNGGAGDDYIYNNGRTVSIVGGEGSDTVYNSSTASAVNIDAGAGNDSVSNGGSNVTISVGDGSDTIYSSSTASAVTVDAGAGNDSINVRGTNLSISGGTGVDTLYLHHSAESIFADAGADNDVIFSFGNNSTLLGGDGNDTLQNYSTAYSSGSITAEGVGINNLIDGGAGNDTIENSSASATISGGTGDDTINNSGENVLILYNTGDGNDSIIGFNATSTLSLSSDEYSSTTSGNDIIVTVGDDSITLNGAASLETVNIVNFINYINNETANSLVSGTDKADSIRNAGNYSTIDGGAGNDTILNAGVDVSIASVTRGYRVSINAGDDNDYVRNNGRYSTINGGDGNDSLSNTSWAFNSYLYGGASDDSISNNANNVTIDGGAGDDILKNNRSDGGDSVSIFGGAGNDTISNFGQNATLLGGDGNDSISNSKIGYINGELAFEDGGENSVIDGGAGDDIINNSGENVLIKYTTGDGNDYISGFNSTSTLSISAVEYSSTTSGNNVVVTVDDAEIILSGAASLETVNILLNPIPSWKLNGTTATYGTPDNILVTVEGVSSTSGLAIDTANNIVTISASSLNRSDVTISDGYTLVLDSDVVAPTFTEELTWTTDGTTATYKKLATTEGYTLSNNQIIYTPTGNGETLVELGGIIQNTYPEVENNKIILSENNLTEDVPVTVISNSGNYEFDLADSVYDAEFIGSAGRDTITNNGVDVTINGGAGNDKILNNGTNSTINGGAGNDIVSLSSGDGGNMFVYTSGDGKDRIFSFKSNDTIKIADNSSIEAQVSGKDVIFNVGKGKITIKDGATSNAKIKVVDTANSDIESISGNTYTADGVVKGDTIKLASDLEGEYTADSLSVVDGSQLENGVSINAGAKGESIIGGLGKDTLISGSQVFTFTGDAGNDVFVYNGGADGRITDYSISGKGGKDKVSIDWDNLKEYDIKTRNLILTFNDEKTLTIDSVDNTNITFLIPGTTKTKVSSFNDEAIFSSKGKLAEIGYNQIDTFDGTQYSKVVTIDASNANYEINLVGNKKANLITAGSAGSTINGKRGKDTLIGGEGNDIFIYEKNSGNKFIQNYEYDANGGDVISLQSGVKITDIADKNGNRILSVGKNKITLEGGASLEAVKFDDGTEKIAKDGMLITLVDGKENSVSLTSGFSSTDSIDLSEKDWINFDASDRKKALTIAGDTQANSLIGSKSNDTIHGGGGNDSINGGAGDDELWGDDGANTFIFCAGDGNDTINDFDASLDKILIQDTNGRAVNFKGKYNSSKDTLTLNVTGGGKVILTGLAENLTLDTTFNINGKNYSIKGKNLK